MSLCWSVSLWTTLRTVNVRRLNQTPELCLTLMCVLVLVLFMMWGQKSVHTVHRISLLYMIEVWGEDVASCNIRMREYLQEVNVSECNVLRNDGISVCVDIRTDFVCRPHFEPCGHSSCESREAGSYCWKQMLLVHVVVFGSEATQCPGEYQGTLCPAVPLVCRRPSRLLTVLLHHGGFKAVCFSPL